ncbi:DUF2975 domain-containing protein [Tissierella sp. P1]|uniref:DUF2975 domain-containing protein n=1 Tax=Tissierella sp. P1 TaxID=1280483 RepID=UPI001303E6B6|nr:DUF2975 domain-containing protein [Tissierella sp. P1]
MNYKSEMQKIKRYSHNLEVVLNAFYWIAIVAACVSLVAFIVILLVPDSNFVVSKSSTGHSGFYLDGLIRYNLNEITHEVNTKNIYSSITIISTLIFVLVTPLLKQLCLILKTIEDAKPFSIQNAKRISMVGLILLLGSFLIPASQVFMASSVINTLKIQNVSTNFSVNLYLILAGFMMFILSGVFKYGSYLQHEYDETV